LSYCIGFFHLEEKRHDTLMEDDVGIDSMFAVVGSIVEYNEKVVGFSYIDGVDHDVTLALGFFKDEGVDLVLVVSVFGGFEVQERESYVHKLMISLHGLFLV
jgi:hypothetical protein